MLRLDEVGWWARALRGQLEHLLDAEEWSGLEQPGAVRRWEPWEWARALLEQWVRESSEQGLPPR